MGKVSSSLALESPHPVWWLAAHLVHFGAFTILTLAVLERDLTQSSITPGIWLAAWFISGSGMVFFLAGAALPIRSWYQIFRRGWLVLVGGLLTGVLAWIAGQVTGSYWSPLHKPTFSAVESILESLGQDVSTDLREFAMTVNGSNGDFTVFIDQGCSGYQGVGLICVFLLAYIWLDRPNLRFPNTFLLLPIGAALIWILNVLRLAALMVIGAWISVPVAVGGFHSQVGWLSFLAVSLGTATAASHCSFLSKTPNREAARGMAPPEVRHLLPFVVLVALGMISAAFSSGLNWLYPIQVVGTAAVLTVLWRGSLPRWSVRTLLDPVNLSLGLGAATVWIAIGLLRKGTDSGIDTGEMLTEVPLVWAAIWLFFRLAGAVVVTPVVEELAFRSYLTRRLISKEFDKVPAGTFSWLSLLASSIVFGILHQRWVAATLLGMMFAVAYYRRGRLEDAIVVHSLANLAIAIFVGLTGHWSLW